MEKLIMLGTGSAMVTNCYNTCFTITDENEHFLVDTGGGNTILANLEKCNISINKLHNVFISHSHNDHITGIIWIIRRVAQNILENKYDGILKIYCHKKVEEIIETICSLILQKKFNSFFGNRIVFIEIEDGSKYTILNWEIAFFDINSAKHLQFGFKLTLSSGKSITFLGDEPYNDTVYSYANGVDYLLHEAYCLYVQREIFHPYDKFHATVKEACENASKLQVRNVLLYHTEDKNILNRKELYTAEGKNYFNGSILVPDDLETIELK